MNLKIRRYERKEKGPRSVDVVVILIDVEYLGDMHLSDGVFEGTSGA